MVLLEVAVLDSNVVLKALVALLITIDPAVVLAVPRVRLEPATVTVPVKLAAEEIVCPLMAPEVRLPVIVALLLTVSAVPEAEKVVAPLKVLAEVPVWV